MIGYTVKCSLYKLEHARKALLQGAPSIIDGFNKESLIEVVRRLALHGLIREADFLIFYITCEHFDVTLLESSRLRICCFLVHGHFGKHLFISNEDPPSIKLYGKSPSAYDTLKVREIIRQSYGIRDLLVLHLARNRGHEEITILTRIGSSRLGKEVCTRPRGYAVDDVFLGQTNGVVWNYLGSEQGARQLREHQVRLRTKSIYT